MRAYVYILLCVYKIKRRRKGMKRKGKENKRTKLRREEVGKQNIKRKVREREKCMCV